MGLKQLTESEVIVRQALKIESLEERLALLESAIERAVGHIYCIGGPLNDNKLQYNDKQKVTFNAIAKELDV